MKKFELVLFMLNVFLGINVAAFATEPDYINDAPLESILSQGTIHQGGLLRSIISLTIVIGLIYLTAWVYKRLNSFNSQKFSKDVQSLDVNKFKVITSQSLGSNKSLHVVEINGKYLVLGATPSSISLLKEFDKDFTDLKSSFIKEKIFTESENKKQNNIANDVWMKELVNKYEEKDNDSAKGN